MKPISSAEIQINSINLFSVLTLTEKSPQLGLSTKRWISALTLAGPGSSQLGIETFFLVVQVLIRELSLHWGCLYKKASVPGAQIKTDHTLTGWTNSSRKCRQILFFSVGRR